MRISSASQLLCYVMSYERPLLSTLRMELSRPTPVIHVPGIFPSLSSPSASTFCHPRVLPPLVIPECFYRGYGFPAGKYARITHLPRQGPHEINTGSVPTLLEIMILESRSRKSREGRSQKKNLRPCSSLRHPRRLPPSCHPRNLLSPITAFGDGYGFPASKFARIIHQPWQTRN